MPNMPRVVDEQRYQTRKLSLPDRSLQFLGMKRGTEDLQVATGDFAEKELYKELKQHYINKKVVVFWGLKLRLPGKGKGGHQEFDFVIVDLALKAVIGIESKATLNGKALQSAAYSSPYQFCRFGMTPFVEVGAETTICVVDPYC